MQATPGADFRKDLQIAHAQLILRKGYHRDINSYSAFYENDRKTHTGLAGYLRERGFARVFLAGLAFDFCVRYSAEDAKREGFEVVVIEDACRGIDVEGSMAATREALAALGIQCISADALGSRVTKRSHCTTLPGEANVLARLLLNRRSPFGHDGAKQS